MTSSKEDHSHHQLDHNHNHNNNKKRNSDDNHPATHVGLTESESRLIARVYNSTEEFFRNPKFDASHDFRHVRRVVQNATVILDGERARARAQARANPNKSDSAHNLDTFLVLVGALVHDVEDKKYRDDSHDQTNSQDTSTANSSLEKMLRDCGVDKRLDPTLVKQLVDGVSYSSEIKDLAAVRELIARIPELAIVQDADRLDAIGAIGIGRCFTFSGAKRMSSLDDPIQHFEDKLLKLEGMMKTQTGREMAAQRSQRIRLFMAWWKEEQDQDQDQFAAAGQDLQP